MEEQDLALFRHKLSQRGGNPWTDQRGAQALVAHGGVLAKLGLSGKSSIELKLVLLGTPVVSKKVGGYAEEPRSQASLLGIEVIALPEGDRERLSCQIISEGRADSTGDKAVDSWEIVPEASLKGSTIGDEPINGPARVRWPPDPHSYVLSSIAAAFPRSDQAAAGLLLDGPLVEKGHLELLRGTCQPGLEKSGEAPSGGGVDRGAGCTEHHAQRPAESADEDGLGEGLGPDVASGSAECPPKPDPTSALKYPDHHDVGRPGPPTTGEISPSPETGCSRPPWPWLPGRTPEGAYRGAQRAKRRDRGTCGQGTGQEAPAATPTHGR